MSSHRDHRRSPRDGVEARPPRPHPPSSLPREVVEEIRATARRHRADEALSLVEEAAAAVLEGEAARAERAATAAKLIAPRSATVRELLGLALYQGERFREALRELQAYRRFSGRPDQNHLIADSHRALGAPEKAVTAAREGLRRAEDEEIRVECAIVAGAALADLERVEEALTVLRSVNTTPAMARPHHLRLWYVIGDVLARAGRRDEAAAYFGLVVRHDAEAFDAAARLAALS